MVERLFKFWHHWGRSWQVIRRRMLPVWLHFDLRRNNQRSRASTQTTADTYSAIFYTRELSLSWFGFSECLNQRKSFFLPVPHPHYFSVCLLKLAQSAQPASANAVLIFFSFNGPCKSLFLKLPCAKNGKVEAWNRRAVVRCVGEGTAGLKVSIQAVTRTSEQTLRLLFFLLQMWIVWMRANVFTTSSFPVSVREAFPIHRLPVTQQAFNVWLVRLIEVWDPPSCVPVCTAIEKQCFALNQRLSRSANPSLHRWVTARWSSLSLCCI